jgi:anthranilate synthase component 2
MEILMIDNYDSFTYNLVHYLESDDKVNVTVKKNDHFEIDEVEGFDRIVISPGPGLPKESGNILEVIEKYKGKKPILGVCMGHQAIGEAFGAQLKNLNEVLHGISTSANIIDSNELLYRGLSRSVEVGRYHSWVIDRKTLSNDFKITAEDEKGEIMSIRHKEYDLVGLQFHPESILTPQGFEMIQNWLSLKNSV